MSQKYCQCHLVLQQRVCKMMATAVLTALRTRITLSPPNLRWKAPPAWRDIAFSGFLTDMLLDSSGHLWRRVLVVVLVLTETPAHCCVFATMAYMVDRHGCVV